jgi:hypothetical protein
MSLVKQVPKIYRRFITVIVATTVVPFAMHCTFAQEKSDEELVKELNNPVGSLISVPFQNNFEFKLGPNNDGSSYTLNFQPVIPFSLNKDWNLITRTIVPYIYQDDVIGTTDQSGLSDIEQSFFFSPQKPVAGIIVGAERNGRPARRRKMGSGPDHCAGQTGRPMDVRLVFNRIWSFAGNEHRTDVSSTFLQPFIACATRTKTTLSLNTESTYNWHNDELTAPINFTVAQLTRIGKLPV